MDLHIAEDTSAERKYGDASLYSTLAPHAMPDDLEFVKSVDVPVRSLASLAQEGRIPQQVGLLKIDTWTKGYYTKRLFLGVPAVIIGGVLLLALVIK